MKGWADMRTTLTCRGLKLDRDERDTLLQYVRDALARFETQVRSVRVVTTDTNGPKGGKDKVVRIAATLKDGSAIEVTADDSDVTAGAARAAARLGRGVARAIDRTKPDRGTISMAGDPAGTYLGEDHS